MSGKQYKANDEDLERYGNDFYLASEQLKTSKHITFDYIKPFISKDGTVYPRTHFKNVETIFKMLAKGKYEHHEPITAEENKWFSKCYNGGLQYSDVGIFECYGYDFSNYYASILASEEFKIPNKAGRERFLKQLPPKIWFGFYNVKITSDDKNVKKIFAFSPEHVYTSTSLKFALELQKTYKIDIELVVDSGNNAYIYPLDTLESGNKIFLKWYNAIIGIKKEFPKNMLTKMLSSSLWGSLSRSLTIIRSEEEAEKLNIGMTDKADYIIKGVSLWQKYVEIGK
jgi:hypothetical protein